MEYITQAKNLDDESSKLNDQRSQLEQKQVQVEKESTRLSKQDASLRKEQTSWRADETAKLKKHEDELKSKLANYAHMDLDYVQKWQRLEDAKKQIEIDSQEAAEKTESLRQEVEQSFLKCKEQELSIHKKEMRLEQERKSTRSEKAKAEDRLF